MQRALDEYVVKGITTNIAYLKGILAHADFQRGDYDTGFLPRAHQQLLGVEDPERTKVALLAAVLRTHQKAEAAAKSLPTSTTQATSGWRTSGRHPGSWKRS
jgi:acetyl-CoA carboxylase biotin carboxylase subunit